MALGWVVSITACLVACGQTAVVPEPDGSVGVDATTPLADGAVADTALPPRDGSATEASSVDAAAEDASEDAGTVLVDASDGGTADGGTGVVLGADGVIRGTVGGTIVHTWHGSLVATDPRCPVGSVVTNGCCVWDGTFANLTVANIPLVFDVATRSGTLAGSPIGAYGVGPTDPDGTVSFQTNPSSNQFPKHWPAIEAIGLVSGESAATLADSKEFKALDLVVPVIFSTSYARVRWNAARSEVALIENHVLQRKAGVGCGTGSNGQSAWTLKSF
jgi:hypothetical protein